MKPIIFLDIDGVLNIAGWKPGKPVCDWDDLEQHHVPNGPHEFPMWLSKKMGERLLSLDAEIQWLTTWGKDAHTVGTLIGLPEDLTVAAMPGYYYHWKFYAIKAFVEEHPSHPFIWLDDDAITSEARDFLSECGNPHLALDIDEDQGISLVQFEQIETFLAGVRH